MNELPRMAETQFRHMGGLSDVDWLVEEGLRANAGRQLKRLSTT